MNTMSDESAQPPGSVRAAVLTGMFTGTATGVGYLLAGVPNLELMSLVVALAGVVLGVRAGALVGALAAALYSLGSPYGMPLAWLLAAQMLGLAGMGILGGVWRSLLPRQSGSGWRHHLAATGVALVGTAWYEAVTTGAVLLGFDLEPAVVVTGAVPFAMIHIGSNLAIFAVLFRPLALRLQHLGARGLTGRDRRGAAVLAAALLLSAPPLARAGEPAPADSLAMSLPPTGTVNNWRRVLWRPFTQSLYERLGWYGDLVPVRDGGLGAAIRILGEASTSPHPLFTRDGLPLGTGHLLADDPALVCIAGMEPGEPVFGMDGWGGTGGRLDLQRRDPTPNESYSSYEGTKGRHETYGRLVQLLTPAAPWRMGFEFQENLDKEGYNYTDLSNEQFDPDLDAYFPGHSRIRQSHARLSRVLDENSRLDIDYDYGRKTKDLLPALGEDHQEVWANGISADMHARTGRLGVRSAVFWRSRDIFFDPDPATPDTSGRSLNTGLEGLLLEFSLLPSRPSHRPAPGPGPLPDSLTATGPDPLAGTTADTQAVGLPDSTTRPEARAADAPPAARLALAVTSWTLDDTGPDSTWAGEDAGPVNLDGQDARVVLDLERRLRGLTLRASGGGLWNNRLGWSGTSGASLSGSAVVQWRIFWEQGGRAPRSDELGTVLRHDVDGRERILVPNPDLRREKTRRWGVQLAAPLPGLDLALDGAIGRTDDGITWRPDTPGGSRGRLVNGVGMGFRRLTASIEHGGRFLGWGRIRYEGTWQDFTLDGLPPALLPPDSYGRLTLRWENHFFEEDGILELALIRTRVGAMADPWDPGREARLPAHTVTDFLVGFRLVGADLSLAFRNLTGVRYRQTSNAWAPGPETVMRLAWRFTR